jgi:hypothetical protein
MAKSIVPLIILPALLGLFLVVTGLPSSNVSYPYSNLLTTANAGFGEAACPVGPPAQWNKKADHPPMEIVVVWSHASNKAVSRFNKKYAGCTTYGGVTSPAGLPRQFSYFRVAAFWPTPALNRSMALCVAIGNRGFSKRCQKCAPLYVPLLRHRHRVSVFTRRTEYIGTAFIDESSI